MVVVGLKGPKRFSLQALQRGALYCGIEVIVEHPESGVSISKEAIGSLYGTICSCSACGANCL